MPGMLAQSPLASPRGVTNSHHTMTEEELSESLIYLTCPICECVFSEEPVFARHRSVAYTEQQQAEQGAEFPEDTDPFYHSDR